LPAFIVLGVLCLLLIGSKLGPTADAQAQLQTGMEDGIMVIPVQIGRDSYVLGYKFFGTRRAQQIVSF
jgi:hypothetical protein